MSPRKNAPVETSPADRCAGHSEPFAVSRRTVLGVGAAVVAGSLPATGFGQGSETTDNPVEALPGDPAHSLQLQTTVNGQPVSVLIDARTSLLDLLRERLALTGAKKGCDHAQCGACTVHVDGRRVASCMTLAAKMEGRQVLTIEGLSGSDGLHPMQQAFIDHDALQCGYCTPGQIMAAVACVTEGNAISRERIREFMSGNICRCGAYVGIVAAIEDAATKMRRG
ncbi:(2Fe-2S)-binding protein [Neorhizobium galegae]|uniref:(2Fe-2S)-binding protein n=1 Tax=Neorhizobium galegae TaxID=399 RepID=UPI00062281EB|nr:(2Fe-2S)-binding protein [Neorhizobium galegae]CDZ67305.1 Putative xanthine dehydrogenase yagT iron-sulfur-binding subunit [Neorhizobium galegae bv. orientalis]MCQ1575163.1 (2Fe-2S)-binding protein [Neorhizobium galegae]MCQ1838630.1 (2Fe-2S)-binding protein [Neorhizobium galegae]UIY32458.1 (2Fe-2S)-binding protein [Neorhizobium galegae]CDZ74009.1 Putative xanthine dehydrogenase yagT iron-sulfur-binding subunit [Neorhizobium galegae bv. orientalis]